MTRWIGVDFSGNYKQWGSRVRNSNVWVAVLTQGRGALQLESVMRVQELQGEDPPFERLTALLEVGDYAAAGIDAPFSVPAQFLQQRGMTHLELINEVANLQCDRRPFPTGGQLLEVLQIEEPGGKYLRETEQRSRQNGINVRSPVWNGIRPGAPMTAACLRLLSQFSDIGIWPWADSGVLVVEAFPAAQLSAWCLPHASYNGAQAEPIRRRILDGLVELTGLVVPDDLRVTLLGSADALDSVLCAFAGKAAASGVIDVPREAKLEGWIAISTQDGDL